MPFLPRGRYGCIGSAVGIAVSVHREDRARSEPCLPPHQHHCVSDLHPGLGAVGPSHHFLAHPEVPPAAATRRGRWAFVSWARLCPLGWTGPA